MHDLIKIKYNLPSTITELKDFIIYHRENLKGYKAKLNAIDRLDMAADLRQEILEEAQYIGECLLYAEVKLGELIKNISREGTKQDLTSARGRQIFLPNGISHKISFYAQTLASNKDSIEEIIQLSREKGEVPTRYLVLQLIKYKKRNQPFNASPYNFTTPINYEIYNEDCITGAKRFADGSIDLMIADPPFGIAEKEFNKHYNRYNNRVINGYIEAPADKDSYYDFSHKWLSEAYRILKSDGSIYIVSSWSNGYLIRLAMENIGFYLINEIIWTYNFPVYTKTKYSSSHYTIYYAKKSKTANPTFNPRCRFDFEMTDELGRKRQALDIKDVWFINKEFKPNEFKNQNKLPEALVNKMIEYSSNPGDNVCDFFLGNGTTAICSVRLDRVPCGFEINEEAYRHFMGVLAGLG